MDFNLEEIIERLDCRIQDTVEFNGNTKEALDLLRESNKDLIKCIKIIKTVTENLNLNCLK